MPRPVSRRSFLAASAGTAGYFLTAPARSAEKVAGSNARLRFAGVGVGGKGNGDTTHAAQHGDMVALCDIDEGTLGKKAKEFPSAEKFFDYRKLFDSPLIKNIDAVTVSTPDHTHALAAVRAMLLGKHVYCQKPLTHSVYEAHLLRKLAKETGVCTQMGNQGTANPGLRRGAELVRAGMIGPVSEVHVWTNRPIWPQAPLVTARPPEAPVPAGIHWDEWIGPAPFRPYAEYPEVIGQPGKRKVKNPYHTFAWRGWWDFGTGAIGDMACHTANLAFHALRLTQPTTVRAEAGDVNPETCPSSAHVTMRFPANGDRGPVTLHWYEGEKDGQKLTPPKDLLAKVLKPGEALKDSGSILVGAKAILFSPDDYGAAFRLVGDVPGGLNTTKPETMPAYSGNNDENQKKEWVEAIRAGKPELAMSNFGAAGLLTSAFLLGNAAMRTGGVPIEWDAETLTATGPKGVMALIDPPARKGWELPALKG